MINLLKNNFKPFVTISIMLSSMCAMGDNHLTLSVSNCISTSDSTMSVDLYIVNDGDSALALNSVAYGLNINAEILNGGTLSWIFSGSSDLASVITNTFSYGWNSSLFQLKLTSSAGAVTHSNAPSLPHNNSVKVGTFTITNTQKWANSATGFVLSTTSADGGLNSGALVYVGSNPISTALNLPNSRGVSVVCSIILATEINSVKQNAMINIYPNPNTGIFHIMMNYKNSATKNIFIFDLLGNLVLESLKNKKADLEINISKNERGVYLLKVIDDGKIFVSKIVLI